MSAGSPEPVQYQPQWQNGLTYSKPTAVVPPGLECLVEVEDVTLKDKVYQTKDGQELFYVRRESECCGPSFNLRLRNPYKRDVLSLYLVSGGCCGGQSYVRISSQAGQCIGIVSILTSSSKLKVSIQRSDREPVFTAEMPISMDDTDSTVEILAMDGSHPVAYIIKEKEGKSSHVTFHFPLNMEAALKAIILGSFLYMSFRVQEMSYSHTSSDNDDGWAIAGGVDFTDTFHHHDHSGHHHGDCGGGDWGGGGDCGGGDWGGGGDCGGGGGDCGGGGGDCGGGGGDCGGGGGDCGGGGCD